MPPKRPDLDRMNPIFSLPYIRCQIREIAMNPKDMNNLNVYLMDPYIHHPRASIQQMSDQRDSLHKP